MDDLEAIEERIRALESELADLKVARAVITKVRSGKRATSPIAEAMDRATTTFASPYSSLTDAVKDGVKKSTIKTTAGITAWVRTHHDPTANKNSIRSLLSVFGDKGLTEKKGDDWLPVNT